MSELCINCLSVQVTRYCELCGYPLCGNDACANGQYHQMECQIMQSVGYKYRYMS